MMVVYIVCALVLVAAFAGVVPMKRAGEQEWARYRRARTSARFRQVGRAFGQLGAALAMMGPAAQQAVKAAAEFEAAMAWAQDIGNQEVAARLRRLADTLRGDR